MEVLIELIREWEKDIQAWDVVCDHLIELGYPNIARYHKSCKNHPRICFLYFHILYEWDAGLKEEVKMGLDITEAYGGRY